MTALKQKVSSSISREKKRIKRNAASLDDAIANFVEKIRNSSSDSESFTDRKIHFLNNVSSKIYSEICCGEGDCYELVSLLYNTTKDMTLQSAWNISGSPSFREFNESVELIRPKSKSVNWNHAYLQPMNWACRMGYVDLLRFIISASPESDIFSTELGGNKLYIGAITFAVLSGNTSMIDFVCRDLGLSFI
jgi:hypothetical protein